MSLYPRAEYLQNPYPMFASVSGSRQRLPPEVAERRRPFVPTMQHFHLHPLFCSVSCKVGREAGGQHTRSLLAGYGWAKLNLGSLRRGRVYHLKKTLLGSREFGNIVIGVGASDVFLHRPVAFFLWV
jgi:hypothetical protein